MSGWPPQLGDVKRDLRKEDTRDDLVIQNQLDAAVAFVERIHPLVRDDAMWLGTVRLAARWYTRRRSPDGLASLGGELGAVRVSAGDPDIDRLLRIGRYRAPVIA